MVAGTDQRGRELLVKGIHLQFLREGKEEYVERIGVNGVVAVLAIDQMQRVVLIEQYRTALGSKIIELPGGMAGDDNAQESLAEAAARELREETGYAAGEMTCLGESPSSCGLTNEIITFFLAFPAWQVGGPREEDARKEVLHHVPIAELRPWLQAKVRQGMRVDYRIHAALFLAQPHLPRVIASAFEEWRVPA